MKNLNSKKFKKKQLLNILNDKERLIKLIDNYCDFHDYNAAKRMLLELRLGPILSFSQEEINFFSTKYFYNSLLDKEQELLKCGLNPYNSIVWALKEFEKIFNFYEKHHYQSEYSCVIKKFKENAEDFLKSKNYNSFEFSYDSIHSQAEQMIEINESSNQIKNLKKLRAKFGENGIWILNRKILTLLFTKQKNGFRVFKFNTAETELSFLADLVDFCISKNKCIKNKPRVLLKELCKNRELCFKARSRGLK